MPHVSRIQVIGQTAIPVNCLPVAIYSMYQYIFPKQTNLSTASMHLYISTGLTTYDHLTLAATIIKIGLTRS